MKVDGYNTLKRNSRSIICWKQKAKKNVTTDRERESFFMLVISLEVLVGQRNEDKKTSLIKDKESHFLFKHQMAKSVSMGLSIHLGFPVRHVEQDERK